MKREITAARHAQQESTTHQKEMCQMKKSLLRFTVGAA